MNETTYQGRRIPIREDAMPILAFKGYGLVWSRGGDFYLNGQGGRVEYDADAECRVMSYTGREPHASQAPELTCTCGFYGVRNPLDIYPAGARAEVEFSGKVISAGAGYRSEHQRLVSIGLGGCWVCGSEPSVVKLYGLEAAPQHGFFSTQGCTVALACFEHSTFGPDAPIVSLERVLERLAVRYPSVAVRLAP